MLIVSDWRVEITHIFLISLFFIPLPTTSKSCSQKSMRNYLTCKDHQMKSQSQRTEKVETDSHMLEFQILRQNKDISNQITSSYPSVHLCCMTITKHQWQTAERLYSPLCQVKWLEMAELMVQCWVSRAGTVRGSPPAAPLPLPAMWTNAPASSPHGTETDARQLAPSCEHSSELSFSMPFGALLSGSFWFRDFSTLSLPLSSGFSSGL